MITVELGNKTYDLPESWEEVKLRQFMKIVELGNSIKDYKSQVLFSLDVFAVLMNCESKELMDISRDSYQTLANELEWATNSDIPHNGKTEFEIDGVTYMLPPDLNQLTMGEVISIEVELKDVKESQILPILLGILLRPAKKIKREDGTEKLVICDFDDEYVQTIEERRELFLDNLHITDIMHVKDFFLSGVK